MEPDFDEIISTLNKKQESRNLLKVLVKIRKEVEWPKNKKHITKIRIGGYLKHLIRILQMPQKSIIDVSLSILGNCIMDRDSAREAMGTYNILSPLGHLLKRYPKEDSLNGRIFRILGNMCNQRDQWANIIIDRTPQLVTHTVELIKAVSKDNVSAEDNYSEATVVMALRALRLLLNSRTIIPLVKTFGVLKVVGSFFIKLTSEWQETKNNENVLHNIIRLLHDYSRYKYYISILEMRNTERGDSFLCLCDVLLLSPKRIVKIIMNFMKISQLKSELPIPEICDRFIKEVTKKDLNIKEFKEEFMGYIQCLCFLLAHPANRSVERCGQCLPLLIKVLEVFKDPTNAELECCILMVTTLSHCGFHADLVQNQMRCNVVRALIDKLRWIRGGGKSSPTAVVKHSHTLKRKSKWTGAFETKRPCRYFQDPCGCVLSSSQSVIYCFPSHAEKHRCSNRNASPAPSDEEYIEFDRIPSPSSSSESDLSFSVSPFGSPNPNAMDDSDTDSDDYSPVCSEAESEELSPPASREVSPANRVFSPTSHDDEREVERGDLSDGMVVEELVETEETTEEEIVTKNLKGALITEITNLMNAYAGVEPPLPELASEELFIELVNCSAKFVNAPVCRVSAVAVVCKILQSPVHLISLMKTTVVEKIYAMMQYPHGPTCRLCAEDECLGKRIMECFVIISQSGMGKGEIAHGLLRGRRELKEQLVLVIPYIVENKSLLVNFLVQCGGLDILMQLLEGGSPHKERAIKALCVLASKRLAIANPSEVPLVDAFSSGPANSGKPTKGAAAPERPVTFKLDDGSSVRADRNLLTEKSEYFASLLSGHFKESGEDVVALHNVQTDSLRCLLHLLKHAGQIERLVAKRAIHTLLDAIVLADRYLLGDLCGALTNFIEKHRMTSKTAAAIYRWSHESGLNLLRVETVAYALVHAFEDDARSAMFADLFGLGYTKELVGDIRTLLDRYLNSLQGRDVCLSD